jgi:hypothetical protein
MNWNLWNCNPNKLFLPLCYPRCFVTVMGSWLTQLCRLGGKNVCWGSSRGRALQGLSAGAGAGVVPDSTVQAPSQSCLDRASPWTWFLQVRKRWASDNGLEGPSLGSFQRSQCSNRPAHRDTSTRSVYWPGFLLFGRKLSTLCCLNLEYCCSAGVQEELSQVAISWHSLKVRWSLPDCSSQAEGF